MGPMPLQEMLKKGDSFQLNQKSYPKLLPAHEATE